MNSFFLSKTPNLKRAKILNITAGVVTAIVLGLVIAMREISIPLPQGLDLSFLVPFHATINALTAIVLIVALVFIKMKRYKAHQAAMTSALVLSLLFLLSYVAYHITTESTIFGDINKNGILEPEEKLAVGVSRTYYLVLLLSHIALAAVIFPFILFTFIRAFTNQFAKHKKMARWVYPLWLYVAITGPIVYWMLKPYY
jgi:putative membrane protein